MATMVSFVSVDSLWCDLPLFVSPSLSHPLHRHPPRPPSSTLVVIQHILEKGRPQDKASVVESIKDKILVLSRHKFASNVVEKCITCSQPVDREVLFTEILSPGMDGYVFGCARAWCFPWY